MVGIGWTPLSEPRRPTPAEQALLDRLVAHVGSAELSAQAGAAWVTAVCDCGCPSVALRSDAPALSEATMTGLSTLGRADWFSVDYARFDDAPSSPVTGEVLMLQVRLHVASGSLLELEIFAGEGVAVELPSPDELDDVTLT
jgi:hypothetical protein